MSRLDHDDSAPGDPRAPTPEGIIAVLGDLGPGAVIMEQGLGILFERHESSIKRAVERGELPPPVRLFGQNAWTAGVLIRHLEERLQLAADMAHEEAQEVATKMLELSP